jgi:hypothetical protein
VSVAACISSQRTDHDVPHALSCRALGVSQSWFYKWHDRAPTARQRWWQELADAIRAVFDASGGTYGSPRVTLELRAAGWRVGENTTQHRVDPAHRRRQHRRPTAGVLLARRWHRRPQRLPHGAPMHNFRATTPGGVRESGPSKLIRATFDN